MNWPLVLLYHIVLPTPADADAEERNLYIAPQLFEAQMEDLYARGFRTMRLREFRETLRGRLTSKKFLLTFDDAYEHVGEIVTPILKKFGFTAVMFAPWGHLGERNTWDPARPNLGHLEIASATEIRRMEHDDWEIASHGLRHVELTSLAEPDLVAELSESRENLSRLLGRSVVDFAYPFGAVNQRVCRAVADAGYQTGFLATFSRGSDRLRIPRQPVRGDEGLTIFRLKTSSFATTASTLGRFTPGWVKGAARRVSA